MAKIVDPDQLNQGTEVVIDTNAKTIQLLIAGNLDDAAPGRTSGVASQAIYSFGKEEWKSDASLNKFRFPFTAIFEQKFELTNGWQWADAQTRDLIRDGGFREVVLDDDYMVLKTLGAFDSDADQAYFQQIAGFDQTTTDFDKTGAVNEPVLINDGVTDNSGFFKGFLRIRGKTYSEGNLLVDQDLSSLTYQAYSIPLSNGPDIKVTESDVNIDANLPYTGMSVSYLKGVGFTTWAIGVVVAETVVQDSGGRWWFTLAGGTSAGNDTDLGGGSDSGVTWEAYVGERQIGVSYFAFNRIIDGNSGTAEEIYEWSQRQLRLASTINGDALGAPNQDGFGTVNGKVAVLLLGFQGDTLQTNPGTYVDSFDVNDRNRIQFFDITVDGGGLDSESVPFVTTQRTFPFVSAGSMIFSDNLVSETNADTKYTMFFSYIRQSIGTDIGITGASGANATLVSTVTDLSNIALNDYFTLDGYVNAGNNGLMQATVNFSATGGTFARVDGITLVDEAATPSVTVNEKPFDSNDAIIVDDNNVVDITGQVDVALKTFDFDYDNNVQGGRDAATDAAVVVVAQGLNKSQWVEAQSNITRTTGLSIPVNASDERNYLNP